MNRVGPQYKSVCVIFPKQRSCREESRPIVAGVGGGGVDCSNVLPAGDGGMVMDIL